MNRRDALCVLGSGAVVTLLPTRGIAADQDVTFSLRSLFGDRPIHEGRVLLKLPKLAESGNSVPLTVIVKNVASHQRVRRACLFASRNPRPLLATILFGEGVGNATFTTNIRLNGTQEVIAVAEFSDGSLWRTRARVLVTVGACDALQTRL